MFSVFFIASFVFVSIIVIMSLRTVVTTTSVVDGMHNVWTTHVPRAQRRWRACLQSAFAPDVPAASRPTGSQWPVTRAAVQAFDVSGVLPREIMCMAGEARTRGACVSSVLCTRVLVCKAQGSECG